MPVILSLTAADLDDETLQALTRELRDDLRDEANLETALVTQAAEAGTKGDVELIGQILLKAVGAGGALAVSGVALFNVLKVYAARKPSLTFKLQKKNGDKIDIKGDDLRRADMSALVEAVTKTLKEDE